MLKKRRRKKMKKCPFSSEECMGKECALWDDAGPRSGCSFMKTSGAGVADTRDFSRERSVPRC